jgi:archaellum component FlaC
VKTHTTLTLDVDKLALAKKLRLNLSKLLSDSISAMVDHFDEKEAEIFEIDREVELINKNIVDLNSRKQELIAKRFAYEEKKKQANDKQIKDLVKEVRDMRAAGVFDDD